MKGERTKIEKPTKTLFNGLKDAANPILKNSVVSELQTRTFPCHKWEGRRHSDLELPIRRISTKNILLPTGSFDQCRKYY
jgi:hypothetical protein